MDNNFSITKDTKIGEILKQYPDLIKEAIKINPKAKMLNNPITKMMIGKITISDMCKQANMNPDMIVSQINQIIKKFKK